MKHENEPEENFGLLPICNFCDKTYDPFDVHTCPGNQIIPRKGTKGPLHAYPEFDGIEGLGSALETQAGGDHYRKHAIQPVEYIVANGISFLAGNIIKYATRYKDKGGAEDVRKIKHYCDLILEFEYKETSK